MEMRGVASIAILPSGSISGHFINSLTKQCFGLYGTQISCERECSRGEDYKLINLSILDFNSKKEVQVIVESHGQDAARIQNASNVHGWEEDVMRAVHGKEKDVSTPTIKFDCETLKADDDAEEHIRKYLPSLAGHGAVVNIGAMHIQGLKFESEKGKHSVKPDVGLKKNSNSNHTKHRSKNDSENVSRSDVSGCTTTDIDFDSILQEELEAEGLCRHRCKDNLLTGCKNVVHKAL